MSPIQGRISQVWLALIAGLALTWLAARTVFPGHAEASRDAVNVNLERIGGRLLLDGTFPVWCTDRRP
jgi:hypothetical protein